MKTTQRFILLLMAGMALAGPGCQQAGFNDTGSEFIPDMAHSIAYEPNVINDYSLHTWEDESTFSRRQLSQPMLPVDGTISRGYTGFAANEGAYTTAEDAAAATMQMMNAAGGGIVYPLSGNVPYNYPDTEEGRLLATEQIKFNPFPITKAGIARGQELYNIYCGICHGGSAGGDGYLVRDNGGKYPAQPANLLDSIQVYSSNGRYYHAIMYGKNAMGSYADKLSYEERWQVIHYIRSLQAQSKKLKYDSEMNTFVAEFGVPEARLLEMNRFGNPEIGEIPQDDPSRAQEAIIETTETEESEGGGH